MLKGMDQCLYKGDRLLDILGFHDKYTSSRSTEIWKSVEEVLNYLQDNGNLGPWMASNIKKENNDYLIETRLEKWDLSTVFVLEPPFWTQDRFCKRIRIQEPKYSKVPTTGTELKETREKLRLSKTELATRLGVHRSTVARAEKRGPLLLPPVIKKSLRLILGNG